MANAFPLAPTLTSPPNNGYVVVGAGGEPVVFEWVFNDPGDYQSQGVVRFKKPGDPDWTMVGTGGAFPTLAIEGLLQPFTYEWQASTVDSGTLGSPWSPSWFFNTIASVPAPTIITPAPDAVITASPLLVSWNLPAGYTQDGYLVQLVRNEAPWDVVYASAADEQSTVQSVLLDIPTVDVTVGILALQVSFTYNGYPAVRTIFVTNTILPPERPLVVLAQVEGKPEVIVSVTNPPASDAEHLDTATWDLYRNGVPIAKDLAPNSSFTDRKVGCGEVDYVVRAVTANGGTATSF